MQQKYSIEVNDIKKSFKVYLDKSITFKEKLIFTNRSKHEELNVINGISFNVKKGEAIGLIGHNGCGKSTTLKMLTRIIYPDSGSIKVNGRVSSLLELGAGFHPDMSGRENIYINASIFGLTKKEIKNRLNDIIKFSELEEFIDNPVRTYSSGMYMRLAFSVAINVEADVLLIDEILAVGDVNFQKKCFNKLEEIKHNGTTIVIVSHSLDQIERICDRTLWINKGKIVEEGIPYDVHGLYLESMERKIEETIQKSKRNVVKTEIKGLTRRGNRKIVFTDIFMEPYEGGDIQNVYTEDSIKFIIKYQCNECINDGIFGIEIYTENGELCYGTNTEIEFKNTLVLEGTGKLEIILPKLKLLEGIYSFNFVIHSYKMTEIYDYVYNMFKIQIGNKLKDKGKFRLDTKWILNDKYN